jgi:type IV secretion system protein VirB4
MDKPDFHRLPGGDLVLSMALARREVPVGRFIPFARHVSADVLKLRENGDLCATWRLHGLPFETAGIDDIVAAKVQLLNFLHAVRGSATGEPAAIWVHRVRRATTDRLPGEFASTFASDLDRRYWDRVGASRMLKTELYFTLLLRPSRHAPGLERQRRRSAADLIEAERQSLDRFEVLCNQVTTSLAKYGGERLGCYERPTAAGSTVTCSSNLAFLHWLLTGVHEEMPLQQGPIHQYLCDARVFAGQGNGVVQLIHPRANTFIGYLDLMDYPQVTEPGLNNCLFAGDYEFVETQSFSFLSKREGIEALGLQRKRLVSSGEASAQELADMDAAIEDVRNGQTLMGEYHYVLGVLGASVSQAQRHMALARASLDEDAGYKSAIVDLIPECAHFSQLPGNWKWRPRDAKLTSRNFASLAPMHNHELGKRDGNPWGQAITLLETPSRQPYYFNWHDSPLGKASIGEKLPGNTFICGMTGAGKSALMGFLLTQSTKVSGLRVLFFDKDRGAEIMIRALGGRYRQLRRGQPTGFNPFQWAPTERTLYFVKLLIRQCAVRGEEVLDVRLENALDQAVERVFALPRREDRRISALLQYVGDESELGQRLSKWCRTHRKAGTNAWVLDNAHDTTDFGGCAIFGFDYTDFLDDTECGPIILGYILEAADTLLNGEPFIYFMEEFAKMVAAKAQTLVEFARDKQTTIRKLNGLGVFITQSPSQVNHHPIGATLREQCVQHIYLPNPKADEADYVNGFKVTPTEFAKVRDFALDSRLLLIKRGSRSAICRLDLGGMADELAVLSGTLDNVLLLDRLRAELGTDDPDVWLRPFLDQVRRRQAAGTSRPAISPIHHEDNHHA